MAAGVGSTLGVGLLAFGFYKLGERAGWWGDPSTIVIDDPNDSGGNESSNDTKPSNGGSKNSIAIGNPPNLSGDAEGYNTTLFPAPWSVRLAMKGMGYNIELEVAPLVGEDETHGEVRRFQADWNRVIRAIDSGKIKLPSSVQNPTVLAALRGLLTEDDVPGKYTLRAMEIIYRNSGLNAVKFSSLRKEAKA
ncbi:hypothetical protein G6O69_21020 [Pseudenhygromyxa sp. WMMC2535]|uniref:hypothetical protein n=1 Tax=Pseudenhygromyxa sp. WMMC2535 TaxID=2712867 RepID=UPI001554F989|nr:hypothetical protein [Pseudenhygromyxa sp. WMMC2535]NVB40336.1 hypothetical protein [Pseudenhygromyxa sp. WMMC2535]